MADPVLATPTLPAGFITKWLERAPPAGSTFRAAVDTAAAAIVWTAPPFVHANFASGGYPADPTLQVPAIISGTHHTLLFDGVANATFKAAVVTAQNAVVWPAPAYPHANFASGGYP